MQPNSPNNYSISQSLTLLGRLLSQWFQVLGGQISFGDPDNNSFHDNIIGVYVNHSFAAPNVEEAIVHNLQLIPAGYLLVSSKDTCLVYQQKNTGTPWTNTTIYLKCTTITDVRLFILGH